MRITDTLQMHYRNLTKAVSQDGIEPFSIVNQYEINGVEKPYKEVQGSKVRVKRKWIKQFFWVRQCLLTEVNCYVMVQILIHYHK